MGFIVYKIANTVNGKTYVGYTGKSLEDRWRKHLRDARYGRQTMLCNAIRKYGEAAFERIILEESEDLSRVLDVLEPKYILETGSHWTCNGYNMTAGGEGSHGYIASEETRRKIALLWTGRRHTEEAKEKCRVSKLGPKNPCFGKIYSDEERAAASCRTKGAGNPNAKTYVVTHPDGHQELVHDRRGFCESLGLKYFSVCSACNQGKPYRGFLFKKVEKGCNE
jgi:group I intron endonuclease